MENREERVVGVVSEINNLEADITQLIKKLREITSSPKIASLEARERAEILLPCEIGAEALGRCLILVTNNVRVLETLGVISLTRYVFELLVWLRTIKKFPLKSLNFIMRSFKDSKDHVRQHIAHLEEEANFFDEMAERDNPVPRMMELKEKHGENLTAELIQKAEKARTEALDLEARRHFAAYAADARINGYGFQAHLIRTQAIAYAQAELKATQQLETEFVQRFGRMLIDEAGDASRWNWYNSASAVDMAPEYEYIYRYTSRLLHATPTSFYTNSKNLELSEMQLFLEYVYVRLLDIIEVVTYHVRRAETRLADQDPT